MDVSMIDTGTMPGRIVGWLSWAKSISEAPRVESCVLVSRSSERHTPLRRRKCARDYMTVSSPMWIHQHAAHISQCCWPVSEKNGQDKHAAT